MHTDPESAGNVTFELQSGSLPPGYSLQIQRPNGGTKLYQVLTQQQVQTTTFNFVIKSC
jgi:hypothetical protein